MPISATTLSLLMSRGICGDDLVEIVAAIDADHKLGEPEKTTLDKRREWDRNRKRLAAETKRQEKSGGEEGGIPPEKPASPSPQRDIIKPSIPTKKSSISASTSELVEILALVVSEETATEIVAHRKAVKSPLSPGSARRLAKALAEVGNPEINAAEMLARGWKGFKSEWMESSKARAGPRNGHVRKNSDIAAVKNRRQNEQYCNSGSNKHSENDGRAGVSSFGELQKPDRERSSGKNISSLFGHAERAKSREDDFEEGRIIDGFVSR